MKQTKTYRFDDNTLRVIDQIKIDLLLSNNSDVLRKAVTLLKIAVDNQNDGGSICLKLNGKEREIVL